MKARGVITLLVSLGIAGLAGLVANNWISQRLGAAERTDDMVQVVSAAVDIPVGTIIEATHIKVVALPAESVAKGSITNVESVLGRVASQPLYSGEFLIEKRLAESSDGGPLAAVIEHGKRALTVRVNDVIGVAGFLLPGSRVDVVSTRRQTNGKDAVSATLLQNVKVLAVDQTVSSDKNDPVIVRAVTLEVSPKQAEKVVKATEEGKVQLTLRNPLDIAETVPPVLPKIAEAEPKKSMPKPRRRSSAYGIDIIRGTAVSRISVNN